MESALGNLRQMFPQYDEGFLRDLITQNRNCGFMEWMIDGNIDNVVTILVSLSSDSRTTNSFSPV